MNKFHLFCCFMLLWASPLQASTLLHSDWAEFECLLDESPDTVAQSYIGGFGLVAVQEMYRSGIPASVKLAQGILESNFGRSQLATKANNHFGIKCGKDWEERTFYLWDDEPQKSCFRVYASAHASYVAHTEFLLNPKKAYRYGFLFEYDKTAYRQWAKGLKKAGYATAKSYGEKLIRIIEKYKLYEYDKLLPPPEPTEKADSSAQVDSLLVQGRPDPFANNHLAEVAPLTEAIFKTNNLQTVYVQADDKLSTIAERYKLPLRKLLKYNDLHKMKHPEARLKVGGQLFLERKAKHWTGAAQFHLLQNGEDLYDVAQRYGLRYRRLLRLNKRYKKRPAQPGDYIQLK